MMGIVILVISFILDIIFSNILPFMKEDLSLFTPLLVPITIYLIYPFYKNNHKKYYLISILVGFIYDLVFTNLLFYDAVIFLLLAFLTVKLNKMFEIDKYRNILYLVLIIIIYESSLALFCIIFNLVPITFSSLFYKISHTLILNIIYGFIFFIIIENLPKRYRKGFINK